MLTTVWTNGMTARDLNITPMRKKRWKKRKKNQKKPVKAKTSEINNFFKSGGFTSSKVTAPKKIDANIDDILEDFLEVKNGNKKSTTTSNSFGVQRKKLQIKKKSKQNAFSFSTMSKRDKPKRIDELSSHDDYSMDIDASEQPSSPIKRESTNLKEEINVNGMEKENVDPQVKKEDTPENINGDVQDEDDEEIDDDSEDEVIVTRRPRAAAANKHKAANFSAVKASNVPSPSPSRPTAHSLVSHTDKA